MLRNLFLAVTCMVFSAVAADVARAPVLVELFTSEGCSSCPPADRHLQQLDSGAIVLSEHVDYWNQLGWKDKFSSPEYTQRQETYAKEFGLESPYTPQMVVDGAAQFTGGDTRRAAVEIDKAANRAKATIVLERVTKGLRVDIEGVPHEADIWLALADDSDTTRVAAGENKGRTLVHVAVVRSLRKIGWVKRGGEFSRQIDLPTGASGQRVVVFLQETGQARVWGVAMLPAPEI
jgi:hypothetical protein